MRRTGTCPKCGDNRIAGPHRVHGGDSWVKIDLPGFSTATLDSYTCANCGYTEFYSDAMGLKNIRTSGRFLQRRPQQARSHQMPTTCPVCMTKIESGMPRCPECGYDLT